MYLVSQFEVDWWVRQSKYTSHLFITFHVKVWGATMDWQIILDPVMAIDYMTKYVKNSDMTSNAACGRLRKSLFHKTVQTERRSVQ